MRKKAAKKPAKRILLLEAHHCTKCGQPFIILVRDDNFALTKKIAAMLDIRVAKVVNLGDKIKCAKCGNEIIVR